MKNLFLLICVFLIAACADSNDRYSYIGKSFTISSGNAMGDGIVNVGAKFINKDRIALYFVDYFEKFLTGEGEPTLDDKGRIKHIEVVIDCQNKTYSAYRAEQLSELAPAYRRQHIMGGDNKWGDYTGNYDYNGKLSVQYKEQITELTSYFQNVCDKGIK